MANVQGEDGGIIGQSSVGDASCDQEGQLVVSIPKNTLNTWASDGEIRILMEINDIPVPPGVQGDGINPCNPQVVPNNGNTDGTSYAFATLTYGNLAPSSFADGATTLPWTVMNPSEMTPTHMFAVGETTVSYLISDTAGNTDTCTFKVVVQDEPGRDRWRQYR